MGDPAPNVRFATRSISAPILAGHPQFGSSQVRSQELLINYFNGTTTSDRILQPAQNSSDEAASKIRRMWK
jgi:hypothetical protein